MGRRVPRLRLLTSAFVLEDSMLAKTNIVTRAILAAAAAGSIAAGVAVPVMTVAAPAAASTVAAKPAIMPYG